MVGSAADRARRATEVAARVAPARGLLNLIGATDLPTLAGVLAAVPRARDERLGRDALGAALGVAVTAVFGPTDERATRPLGDAPRRADASDVWCRPCMLRECPLDHRCMRGIGVAAVLDAVRERDVCDDSAAVFLDRDGTLIEEVGYLDRPDRVALYPWTIDAIRALNRAGLPVVVVTNQSGVARGFFTEAIVDAGASPTSPRCSRPAARASTRITIVRTIPTARSPAMRGACDCRKPGRGLVDRAVARSRPRSGALVRRRRPVARRRAGAGGRRARHAGAHRLRRGRGAARRRRTSTADAVVDNLAAAASWILGNLRNQSEI